jgi:hypothetical protein
MSLLLTSTGSSGASNAITYHAGWNIVGAPEGTRYAGADGPLFTLQPGDQEYEVLPAGTPALGAQGYWAYFPVARTVQMPDGVQFLTVELPPGQWVLVGNPSGARTSPVSGADALFTWDPGRGYRAAASLLPGQGAWAYSQAGGLLTIGITDQNGDEVDPQADIPSGPVGAVDASGCRTGDVLAGVYHPIRLQVLDSCRTVTGTVISVKVEADGDYHVNVLPDSGQEDTVNQRNRTIQHGAVVVEVIPADQREVAPPLLRDHVQVTGAFVLDKDHGWIEIHPAWSIVQQR